MSIDISNIVLATNVLKYIAEGVIRNSDLTTRAASIFNEINASKKDYEERIVLTDPSPIKKKREKLISDLNLLQNEILITVSDTNFLARALPLLLEQIVPLYQVKTEEELGLIALNLGQIRGYLEQYKNLLKRRSQARWSAIVVSIFVVAGLIALIIWSSLGGPKTDYVIPLLEVPLPILLWSTIGSFTAILYRFNNSGDIELQDPLRWLFTRPLTGIVIGMLSYYVFRLGLLTVSIENTDNLKSPIILWVAAFLISFSDKFMDSLLHSLVGKFGGNASDQLVNLDYTPMEGSQLFKKIVDFLPIPKQQEKPPRKKPKKQNPESPTK